MVILDRKPECGEGQAVGVEPLEAFFARVPKFALAFSGGCDSSYVLAAAVAAGCDVKAYMVNTAFQPAFELEDARRVVAEVSGRRAAQEDVAFGATPGAGGLRAEDSDAQREEASAVRELGRHDALGMQNAPDTPDVLDERSVAKGFGAHFEVIEANVLARADICANPPERCYLCKRFIFGTIQEHMRADGYDVLVDGTNASDDPVRRPGFRALAEMDVVSPLRRAGMTKDDVRAASRALGVSTADKPSFSCLATQVPAGEAITATSLEAARIARGL